MVKLAEVIPFRGLRYNQSLISDLSLVVAPPYDVISPEDQEDYYRRHESNAVRLDYGLTSPGDTGADNCYVRAANTLNRWLDRRVLQPDPNPAIYCVREEYNTFDGTRAIRNAFIAAVRLSDFSEGIILPHEETASGPKKDRLRLMEATEANLSPIYCLYSDPENTVGDIMGNALAGDATLSLTDEAGTRHSMWVADDPEMISAVGAFISERTLLIADGHHRYETALAYRDIRRSRENPAGDRPFDFIMAYLSSMEGARGSILPIHRLVSGLSSETLGQLAGLLDKVFEVRTISGAAADRRNTMISEISAASGERNTFGMYLPGNDSYHLLVARQPRPMIDSNQNGHSPAYRSLDVAVLDRIILADLMGISPGGANANARVQFVEQDKTSLDEIGSSGCQAAFFVNPATMEEIKVVSEAGEKMPQKSTFFYPKPLTGLVFRSLKAGF